MIQCQKNIYEGDLFQQIDLQSVLKSAMLLIMVLIPFCLVQSYHLPIQAHSFNDLDYLSNLIDKGVNYFKLDVSMANRQSCLRHPSWNSSEKCLNHTQYTTEICCLVMRGDTSSTPYFKYDFNLTQQFSTLLQNKMPKIVEENRVLLFAINFQYGHSFSDYFTERFLAEIANILEQYPKNLLIGTGSESFILEYDKICYGKGAPECTPQRRKISESKIFLQTSSYNPVDPRDHYKRYRNFNVFYKQIVGYCRDGFPDWISKYPEFPLIFWEPSNEQQIQFVLEHFTSSSCMKKHMRSLDGMAIATNIDPEMFQIYMKKLINPENSHLMTNDGYSWPLISQKVFLKNQRMVMLTKIQEQTEILIQSSIDYFDNQFSLFAYNYKMQKNIPTVYQLKKRQFSSLLSPTETPSYLLASKRTVILITSINDSGKFRSKIYYFNYDDNFELLAQRDWEWIQAACIRDDQLLYAINSNTTGRVQINGMKDFKEQKQYAQFQLSLFMERIISISFSDEYILIAGNSQRNTSLAVMMFIQDGQLIAPEKPLAYGTNPQFIKLNSGLGIVVQNSMCSSGLLLNNGDMNKCTYYQQPEFYSARAVRGLINFINSDFNFLAKNDKILSPCIAGAGFTKLMNGYNPSLVELSTWGVYMISASYIKIENQDILSSLFCGGSNFGSDFSSELGSVVSSFSTRSSPKKIVQRNKIQIQ